jgi:hypothetical protein
MSRQSVEDRAASVWRAGGEPPTPPARLKGEARKLWITITADLAVDHFRPANHELLAQFCEMCADARRLAEVLATLEPTERAYAAHLRSRLRLATNIRDLAKTLRITPQAGIDRKSGRLAERGAVGDPLLGGFAVPRAPVSRRSN